MKQLFHLLNTLKVFTFAESLGGVRKRLPILRHKHADIPAAEVRKSYSLTDDLLRLSIWNRRQPRLNLNFKFAFGGII